MQQELNKAQQLARKYHQMYDMERRRNGYPEGANITPEPDMATPRPNNASTFLGQNVRVNDIIRKNEVCKELCRDFFKFSTQKYIYICTGTYLPFVIYTPLCEPE